MIAKMLNKENDNINFSGSDLCEADGSFYPCTDYTLFDLAIGKNLSYEEIMRIKQKYIDRVSTK